MIKWLIKSQNEFRLETMTDVEEFHKEMQKKAADEGYTLSSFSWTKREKKQGGEIVDEWYIVKVAFIFNDAKEPENQFSKVEYPNYSASYTPSDSGDPEVFEEEEDF